MLEEKTYSISELAAIIGGSSDRQAIKRKLERRHILYSIQGRGSKATFKIETQILRNCAIFIIIV